MGTVNMDVSVDCSVDDNAVADAAIGNTVSKAQEHKQERAFIAYPAHGGDLQWAENTFKRPVDAWIDLSTGVSPWVYPIPAIPEKVWQQLPYGEQDLLDAAGQYFQCPASTIMPVNGSQSAIHFLPQCFGCTSVSCATVAIPAIAYSEHRQSWLNAGYTVLEYHNIAELRHLVVSQQVQNIVMVNPNNPTGKTYSREQLLALHRLMSAKQVLIVDEAFMDLDEHNSLSPIMSNSSDRYQNIIILRSIGKFFGLAGVRLGFVLHNGHYAAQLRKTMPLWNVSSIALWLGAHALRDKLWQAKQRQRIEKQHKKMFHVVNALYSSLHPRCDACSSSLRSTGLFITWVDDLALLQPIFLAAAKAGILLRYGEINKQTGWLRIGLSTEKAWTRVDAFFSIIAKQVQGENIGH